MKEAIMVDIDGTLCQLDHRLHYVRAPKNERDYEKFYSEINKDIPKKDVIKLLDKLYSTTYIILITGRPERYRDDTVRWLKRNSVFFDKLIMRSNDEYEADEIIKEKQYKELVKPKYQVIGVFDDRQKVVNMWRRIGLTCYQVEQWEEYE